MASTTADFIPEQATDLTPDWLTQVLATPVSGCRQSVLGQGQGFMGEILRLEIEAESGAAEQAQPGSLIAKLPHPDNRAMGELLGVYEREIMFFRTLGQQAPVRLPALYYSDFDRDKGSENQEKILRTLDRMPLFLSGWITRMGTRVAANKKRRYVLLMEDLGHMTPADQLAGLDAAGCARVLEALAPLHRHFWNAGSLREHFWLIPLDADARLRHGRFRSFLPAFVEQMGAPLGETLGWLADHGESLTRRFVADAPETLVHGDMRLDNVIFDGDECAFIDWQLVRRAPAAYDIAYFLTGALGEEATAAEERWILQAYHNALNVPGYALDHLLRDYQRALLLILANMAGASEVELGNARGSDMMSVWLRRLRARTLSIEPAALL